MSIKSDKDMQKLNQHYHNNSPITDYQVNWFFFYQFYILIISSDDHFLLTDVFVESFVLKEAFTFFDDPHSYSDFKIN